MAKSADAFRTISEVADWLGVPAHVLRFWESKFSQVKPVKRAGGRRYYRPSDMQLLGGIRKLLHDDGMTIKGVQKILRENGIKHVAAFSGPLDVDATDDLEPLEHDAAQDDSSGDAPMQTDAEADTAKVLSFSRDSDNATGPTRDAPGTEDAQTSETPQDAPAAPPSSKPEDAATGTSPAAEQSPTETAAAPTEDPADSANATADDLPNPKPDAAPEATAPPAPAAPRPTPIAHPTDPTDDITAPSGTMAALAALDLGRARESRAALRAIADRLRAVTSATPPSEK